MGGLAASPNFVYLFRDLLGAIIHGHVVYELFNFLLIVGLRECRVDQILAQGLNVFVPANRAWIFSFGNALSLGDALYGSVLGGRSLCASERAPLAEVLTGSWLDVNTASLLDVSAVLLVDKVLVPLLLASRVILYTARKAGILDDDRHLLDPFLLHTAESSRLVSNS